MPFFIWGILVFLALIFLGLSNRGLDWFWAFNHSSIQQIFMKRIHLCGTVLDLGSEEIQLSCFKKFTDGVVWCRRRTRKLAVRIEHNDYTRGYKGCGRQSVGVNNSVWGGEVTKETSQNPGGGRYLPNE